MQLHKFTQENILVLLCFDTTDSYRIIRNVVSVDLFDAPYYRKIAEKAYAYIDRYQKVPNVHIADELITELTDPKDGATYKSIVDNIYNQQTSVNSKYVIDKIKKFISDRQFEVALVKAAQLHRSGETEKAIETIRDIKSKDLDLFDPGIRLSDLSGLLLDSSEEAFPTGIKELDRQELGPRRKHLILFAAPRKAGKTFWLVHLSKHSLFTGLKVLYITLEIPQKQIYRRFIQSIFGLTQLQTSEIIQSAVFLRDANNKLESIDLVNINPKSLQDDGIQGYVKAKLEKFGPRSGNLIIKEFPSGQLNTNGLNAYLDGLEATENFIPDLIALDFLDYMELDPADIRQDISRTNIAIRGIGGERNIAMTTAAQINRIGAGAKLRTSEHLAENYARAGIVDTTFTYNQTPAEYNKHLARLFVDSSRVGKDKFMILLSQNYSIGNFSMDSELIPSLYNPSLGTINTANSGDNDTD